MKAQIKSEKERLELIDKRVDIQKKRLEVRKEKLNMDEKKLKSSIAIDEQKLLLDKIGSLKSLLGDFNVDDEISSSTLKSPSKLFRLPILSSNSFCSSIAILLLSFFSSMFNFSFLTSKRFFWISTLLSISSKRSFSDFICAFITVSLFICQQKYKPQTPNYVAVK